MSDDREDNVVQLREIFEKAQPVAMEDEPEGGAIDDAPPMGEESPPEGQYSGGGGDGRSVVPMRDWPVRPLGRNGGTCYYLDDLNQLRALDPKEHSRNNLVSLFGRRTDMLLEVYPRKDKDGNVTGFQPEKYLDDLQRACALQGVWNPLDRVRGAGAWQGEDGELILHCGDLVIVLPRFDKDGKLLADPWDERVIYAPDLIDRIVYPATPAGPKPHEKVQAPETDGPGREIISILETWNWKHPELDAYLLFGWLSAAYLGGALEWRPSCWLTGGRGTGKSTLDKAIDNLLNNCGIFVSDPTAAAIWQKLGSGSVPVILDEIEAKADNRKSQNIIELARQASSGGVIVRGGNDHNVHEFIIRSPFMFSSILVPPMEAQDRSRQVILELDPLKNSRPPDLSPKRLRGLGKQLFRRVVDGWSRLPQAIEQYQAALQDQQLDSRACDQFGTLLAAADLALYDGDVPPERARYWAEGIVQASKVNWGDDDKDEDEMVRHLLSSTIDPWRSGSRQTVAELLEKAWGRNIGEYPDKDAIRALGMHGMKVAPAVMNKPAGDDNPMCLYVANKHRGLEEIFDGTHWAKGVWKQAVERLPNSGIPPKAVYFGGVTSRAVQVLLEEILPTGRDETCEPGAASRTQQPPPDPDQGEIF